MNYNFKKKILLFGFLIIPIVFLYFKMNDTSIIISNFILTLLILIGFIFSKSYSLNTVFYIFSYLFFCVVPLNDYVNRNTYWGGEIPKEKDYVLLNIILIMIIFVYSNLYRFLFQLERKRKRKKSFKYKTRSGIIFIVISCIIYFIYLSSLNFNLSSPFYRSTAEGIKYGSTIGLIYLNIIRPVMIYLIWIEISNNGYKRKITLIVLSIIGLCGVPPTGMARFQTATLYAPVLLMTSKIARKYFKYIIIFSIVYILPYLDKFRRYNEKINWDYSLDFFNHGHFDSYQNFLRVVSNEIITNGNQLTGVIFSWIPRVYWESKPVGSGTFLAQKINLSFSNISMNYFGEGYINFGILGVLIFIVILATINATLDKIYWSKNYISENFKLYYLMIMMLEFFILRGDLMSSLTYSLGMCASLYLVTKLTIYKKY